MIWRIRSGQRSKRTNQKSDIPMSEWMSGWSKRSKLGSERSDRKETECSGAKQSMAEQSGAWWSKVEHGAAKHTLVEQMTEQAERCGANKLANTWPFLNDAIHSISDHSVVWAFVTYHVSIAIGVCSKRQYHSICKRLTGKTHDKAHVKL